MLIQTAVSPQNGQGGANPYVQGGRDGEVIAADFHGRYYTANYNSRLWTSSTAVAGVAPGTALGTTVPIALWNPTGSKVNLEIIKFSASYVSGTLGAGFLAYAGVASATPSGTRLTSVSGQIGNNSSASVGQAWQGAIPTAPTIIRGSGISLLPYLATSVLAVPPMVDELAGEFVIVPGGLFAVQGIAGGGTSPLMVFSLTWIESPI
jgi:hypothetical protein